MDLFIEKIVSKRKKPEDYLITTGLIILGFILFIVGGRIKIIQSMWLLFAAAIIYGLYYLIKARNIEFEYAVTNGDIDIDEIIAQRKRKRIFSANCKDFEIIARLKSDKHGYNIQNIQKRIVAVSSMDSPDVFFVVTVYKGEKVVVFFEPDKRMLDSFKMFIPRKVFD